MTTPAPDTTALEASRVSHNDSDADLTARYWGQGVGAGVLLCFGVLVLSPLILVGNALLLNALYRFKRLRTPSNYLLASLASSDLGVGVLLPLCAYLELSDPGALKQAGSFPAAAPLCALPHCLLTSLCCASLLVMAAIAVDRFTSLAQPLRYNNLITHRSVERYIAGLWLYAGIAGTAPMAVRLWVPAADPQADGGSLCSGTALLRPPGVALFLLLAVYAPCAVMVVGCYSYVYLVARTHHRAIYSVEISLRHAHDAPYTSRYTSTLAITVGFFVCLWLPFQAVMVVDLIRGSHLLSSLRTLCLSLPMFASSALNPWVYGYRNGEVRAAVQRVLHEMLSKVGLSSPHFGCPHLVTTGADAELNSFASNVRLCTMSATHATQNTQCTHHTLVPPGSPMRGPSEDADGGASDLEPSPTHSLSLPVSGAVAVAVFVTPPTATGPSPLETEGTSLSTMATASMVSSRIVRAPASPGLLAPAGPTPPSRAPPATVINLAQTVIELRVPVPDGRLKQIHHV